MDTTHTFHLPFREMTISLLIFTGIIGLSFSGEPIPLSNEAYSSRICSCLFVLDVSVFSCLYLTALLFLDVLTSSLLIDLGL